MIIKIIGCLLIICACASYGYLKAFEKSERAKKLRDIETMLEMLYQEIACLVTPLPEAFRLIAKGKAGDIFINAAKLMEKGKGTSEAWEKAVLSSPIPFSNSDIEILLSFGQGLQAQDKNGQLSNILLCKERIKAASLEAEIDSKKKGKLYKNGGLLIGILVSLILY